jgi:hypothetical protein
MPHCLEVVVHGSSETLYRPKAASVWLVQPFVELVDRAAPQDPQEAHREVSHVDEARRRLLQGLDLRRLRGRWHARRRLTQGGRSDRRNLPVSVAVISRSVLPAA